MFIELNKVSRHFEYGESHQHREVLKEVSLSVSEGDSLAIIGPSGSGKSTLLNIIGTLDRPDSGVIRYNGKEAGTMTESQLADFRNNHIGFIFQMHHLLPQLTLLENVMVPVIPKKDRKLRKAAMGRAMDLLDHIGLAGHIHQLPGQLSGGECQKAAVVRALINEPEVILADEPTGSLDHENAEQLGLLLSGLNKDYNVSLVVVSHSPELAEKMNIIYSLTDGRLTMK